MGRQDREYKGKQSVRQELNNQVGQTDTSTKFHTAECGKCYKTGTNQITQGAAKEKGVPSPDGEGQHGNMDRFVNKGGGWGMLSAKFRRNVGKTARK